MTRPPRVYHFVPKRSLLILGSLAFLPTVGRSTADDLHASPASGVASPLDESSLMKTWGWLVARDQDLAGVELNEAELTRFLAGVRGNLQRQRAQNELYSVSHDIDRVAAERRRALQQTRARKNEALAEQFFSTLKTNPKIAHLPTGAWVEIVREGKGPRPSGGQTVTLTFAGHLLDGTEFARMNGYDLVWVKNRISPALFEALLTVHVGSEARIYLPASLASQDPWAVNLPPGSATVYEIALLAAKDTAPDDLANSLLPAAPEPPAPPPTGKSTDEIIEAWGWTVGHKTGAETFHLSSAAIDRFLEGLGDGIKGRPAAVDLRHGERAVTAYVSEKRSALKAHEKAKRLEAMSAFLETLKANPNVVELPDGLRYEIVRSGTGAYPAAGDTVIVDYTARLLDGTVFDRTDNEPLHVEVGSVIPGWNEGIQHINKGGRIRLYVPPVLGYGEGNTSGVLSAIPGNSFLIYDIELLDTQPASVSK